MWNCPHMNATKPLWWLVRWWLGTSQVTSHYLNQWWLDYWSIYASSLGLNEFMYNVWIHGFISIWCCQICLTSNKAIIFFHLKLDVNITAFTINMFPVFVEVTTFRLTMSQSYFLTGHVSPEIIEHDQSVCPLSPSLHLTFKWGGTTFAVIDREIINSGIHGMSSFWRNFHHWLTTCLLHVAPPFVNRILNNSWAVGLT